MSSWFSAAKVVKKQQSTKFFASKKNGTTQEMAQNGEMEDPQGSHMTSLRSLLQLLFH
jgi:hypothetical protein